MHSSIHRKNIYWLCRGLYLFINKIQCLSKNVSSKICLTTNPVCPHGLWGQGSNVPGVQIAGTVQRDLNACNKQGTRLRKNYKVTQTLKTGATVKMIYFSRGGGVMKTTNLRQIDLRL